MMRKVLLASILLAVAVVVSVSAGTSAHESKLAQTVSPEPSGVVYVNN